MDFPNRAGAAGLFLVVVTNVAVAVAVAVAITDDVDFLSQEEV